MLNSVLALVPFCCVNEACDAVAVGGLAIAEHAAVCPRRRLACDGCGEECSSLFQLISHLTYRHYTMRRVHGELDFFAHFSFVHLSQRLVGFGEIRRLVFSTEFEAQLGVDHPLVDLPLDSYVVEGPSFFFVLALRRYGPDRIGLVAFVYTTATDRQLHLGWVFESVMFFHLYSASLG